MAFCGCLDEILRDCDGSVGGLRTIYAIPFESATLTYGTGTASGYVTGLSIGAVNGLTCSFVEVQVNKDSSSYTEEGNIDLVNGTTLYTVTLSAMIGRRDVAKRNAIMMLAAGQQELLLVLKDNNGLYWLMGSGNGANLTGVGEGSGQAKADNSKYSLTFTSEENEMMYELDPALVITLGL